MMAADFPDQPSPGLELPGSHVTWRLADGAKEPRPVSVAMGIFDGVHQGHQAVLASALEQARRFGGRAAVLTFTPHPSRILRPDQPTLMLFSEKAKERRLFQAGIDLIIWKHFDLEFAKLDAAAFVEVLVKAFPTLASIHVGENFRFGQMRAGDPTVLHELLTAKGILVQAVPRFEWKGEAVSSTRLRQALAEGCIEAVNTMLGMPYRCSAAITKGRQLGSRIGFPTFNLPYAPEAKPRLGVYAVRVWGKDGAALPAIANYGLRPTVEETATQPLLEIHLLSAVPSWSAGDLLTVEWLSFLRPEQRFNGLDALRAQIENDVQQAKQFHGL